MPLLWIGILVALPLLDIYATIRFAEALSVPGWALFVPGFVFGIGVLRHEARTMRERFATAMQRLSLRPVIFDSGRRLLAGVLLMLPGVLSDALALLLLLIPTRGVQAVPVAATGTPQTMDGEFRRVD